MNSDETLHTEAEKPFAVRMSLLSVFAISVFSLGQKSVDFSGSMLAWVALIAYFCSMACTGVMLIRELRKSHVPRA
jgi:uncharacterized membrane protein